MHAYIYVCIHMYVHIYIYVCIYIHTYTHVYTCTFMYMYINVHICVYECTVGSSSKTQFQFVEIPMKKYSSMPRVFGK